MNFIQNDANIVDSSSRFLIGYLQKSIKSVWLKSWWFNSWKLNLKARIKILSVCALIDDKNKPISAQEIGQLFYDHRSQLEWRWRRDTSSASRLSLTRLDCWLFTYLLTSLVKNQRFGIKMSLMTCSKIVRPCLSLFRPAADPSRLNRCRLFSSLQKQSTFVAGRLLSRHYWKGNPHRESGWPISDNGLVILGFSLLGSTLLFVSMRNILFVFCVALLLCPYVPVNDHFQTRNT